MDDWIVECSDEELKDCKGSWEPSIEEIDKLYTMLENDEIPELEWKSPGYKSPTPETQPVPIESLNEIKQLVNFESKRYYYIVIVLF